MNPFRPAALVPLALGAAALARVPAIAAQGPAASVDRTKPPVLAAAPALVLPQVQETRLGNGIEIVVVPMREVPVVQVTLSVRGGARADGDLAGLATFTADMLDEGAGTRDAFGLAAEAEYLGASLRTAADWENVVVSLKTPKRTLGPALALMADVALRPTFAAAEVARQRDLRLARILQSRDRAETVAGLAFDAILFPAGHPYRRPIGGDSASTVRLDSAAVRGFWARAFQPARATFIVTGDVSLAEARAYVQRAFGAWRARGGRTPEMLAAEPQERPTAVYLVDKPNAAQSVIRIGHGGVRRDTKDYAALEVMNTLLGGSFSSRLNDVLREQKGYTYGARSGFAYGNLPGAFTAGAAVRTNVTDSSLAIFARELGRIRDEPVSEVELARARNYVALRLASDFETPAQMAAQLAVLRHEIGEPLAWYGEYVTQVQAVTAADVQRVARQYLRPDRFTVVVVGDLAKIRAGVEALKIGPVSVRDYNGNEVTR